MSVLAVDTGAVSVPGIRRPFSRLFGNNVATAPTSAVAPTNYIPYSTADMWRSSRRSFAR